MIPAEGAGRTRPPQSPVRVALLGYGIGGAAFHAPLIATTPEMRLAAIVTRDPVRVAAAQRDHPDTRIVASADELWNDAAEFDLAVVSTPNRTHAPLATAALGCGLDVVVDKPMAVSAREGRELAAVARGAGRLLIPYQNRRWDGDFLTLRRLLADGSLGTMYRMESRFERWRPVPKPGWRESAEVDDAGGLLFDLGSHLIDQALVLFGDVRFVYAELDRRREGVHVEDDVFVALTHRSGVRTHLHASVLAAQVGPRFRLLGSEGSFTKWGLDVQEDALRNGVRPGGDAWGEEAEEGWGMLGADGTARRVRTERGDYPAFYGAVAAAIRGEGLPPVAPSEAIAGLRVIEAARLSSAEGRVVELETASEVPPIAPPGPVALG